MSQTRRKRDPGCLCGYMCIGEWVVVDAFLDQSHGCQKKKRREELFVCWCLAQFTYGMGEWRAVFLLILHIVMDAF